MTPISVYRIN